MEAGQARRDNSLDGLLAAGREAYSQGDTQAAHELWRMAAVANPYDERVWAALMEVLTSDDDREVCLENIIAINPLNPDARRQLRAIKRSHTVSEETVAKPDELESASRRQTRAIKREERLKAEAAASDEPVIPPPKSPTVRSIAPQAVVEPVAEQPQARRSALRYVLRGIVIGLIVLLIALVASAILNGRVLL